MSVSVLNVLHLFFGGLMVVVAFVHFYSTGLFLPREEFQSDGSLLPLLTGTVMYFLIIVLSLSVILSAFVL